jgi:hypothetical protein
MLYFVYLSPELFRIIFHHGLIKLLQSQAFNGQSLCLRVTNKAFLPRDFQLFSHGLSLLVFYLVYGFAPLTGYFINPLQALQAFHGSMHHIVGVG